MAQKFEDWLNSIIRLIKLECEKCYENPYNYFNETLKSFVWQIAPLIMVFPSFILRMKDKSSREPLGDILTVYSEGVAVILFIIYVLRQINPQNSFIPSHVQFGREQSYHSVSAEDESLLPVTDNKKKGTQGPSFISKFFGLKEGEEERYFKTLYTLGLVLFLMMYMLIVVSDFMYQLEGHTVLNEDAIEMGKALMEGNGAFGTIFSILSHPLSILIPVSIMVMTFIGLKVFAENYSGASMIRSCSQRKGDSLYWSAIFLTTAISLVVTTGSWSPCAHLFVINSKLMIKSSFVNEMNTIDENFEVYETNIRVHSQAMLHYKKTLNAKRKRRPNVIFMVSDSLSGYALNSPAARRNMPFFRQELAKHEGFVEFKNSRATSSLTAVAMSAVLAGIAPIDKESGTVVKKAQVGRRFEDAGYETGVFSPVKLHFENSWRVLSDNKRNGFKTAVDIESLDAKVANCCTAMDDRLIIDEVEKWLDTHQGQAGKSEEEQPPFMMLLFTNHLHPHYIIPEESNKNAGPKIRYLESLKVHDQIIQRVFTKLQQTGNMENTVLVAASDHGEMPKDMGARAHGGAPALLNNAMWSFVGRDAMADEGHFRHTMENLRQNSNKLVSGYDALPTLMSLAGVQERDLFTKFERDHYVHGESLALGVLPDNRVVYGWQGQPFSHDAFGAIYSGDEAFLFSNKEEVTGIVHYPPQTEEQPNEDPFPELKYEPLGMGGEYYKNLLNMAPLRFQEQTKNIYKKVWDGILG